MQRQAFLTPQAVPWPRNVYSAEGLSLDIALSASGNHAYLQTGDNPGACKGCGGKVGQRKEPRFSHPDSLLYPNSPPSLSDGHRQKQTIDKTTRNLLANSQGYCQPFSAYIQGLGWSVRSSAPGPVDTGDACAVGVQEWAKSPRCRGSGL